MKRLFTILTLFLLSIIAIQGASAGFNATTYLANGTYTAPTGVTLVMVEAWGGGGGGGGGGTTPAAGGGGGGGYVRSYINITPGTTYNVTVGIGGAGCAGVGSGSGTCNNGTASWFNSTTTIYADFGRGGGSGSTNNGGAGGSNNTGQVKFNGGAGGNGGGSGTGGAGGGGAGGDLQTGGTGADKIAGGGGGGNSTNRGGKGGVGGGNSGSPASNPGNSPGGGGGAGGSNSGAGAAGANGLVRIWTINDQYSEYFFVVQEEATLTNISAITNPINYSMSPSSNQTGTLTFTNITSNKIYVPPAPASDPINLRISATNYTERRYLLIGSGNTTTNSTLYLASSTANTQLIFVDQATNVVINQAAVYMQREINGIFTTVESQYSDVTGTTSFDYIPGARYSFTSTATGYTTKNFVLDPILFSTYTIKMLFGTSSQNNLGEDYQNILIDYSPKTFYANQSNTFTILFNSITNSFTNYTWNLTYPGGSKGGSGTNPAGSTFVSSFNITGGNLFSTANLSIQYTTSTGSKNFTSQYGIIYGPNNGTFVANQGQTYGMGLIDRVLIGILIIVLAAGIISLAVSPVAGLVMALFLMGLFIYMGFWEWWLAGISFLIGFILIIRRTE